MAPMPITAPLFGELRVDDGPVSEGGIFTQDDVNHGRISYQHNGLNASADKFSFTVVDGAENGNQSAAGTFSISITVLTTSLFERPH